MPSIRKVAKGFEVTPEQVQQWIDQGLLKATGKNISEDDLSEFVNLIINGRVPGMNAVHCPADPNKGISKRWLKGLRRE